MKLQLETQVGVATLSVSGAIGIEKIAVLKAGLSKMSQSGNNRIVLDLTELGENEAPQEVAAHLDRISKWAYDSGFQLLTAWNRPGFGDAATRDEAKQILASPNSVLLTEEAALAAEIRHLERKRDAFLERLEPLQMSSETTRSIRNENAKMQRIISLLQLQIEEETLKQKSPTPSLAAWDTLWETLQPVLTNPSADSPSANSKESSP